MIKSMSMMRNVDILCSDLRKCYFGEEASKKDYKDSYVINKAIESYDMDVGFLMDPDISTADSVPKCSKSINFRADVYTRICDVSKKLSVSEAEACRRLLLYAMFYGCRNRKPKGVAGMFSEFPGTRETEADSFVEEPIPAFNRQKTDYTIDDYYALPDDTRVELINGAFYDMAAPSVVHQIIVGGIYTQMRSYVSDKKLPCIPMLSPLDVRLNRDEKTMVEPDVMIICDRSKITKKRIEGAPEMIVEVVSPGTWYVDADQKLELYRKAGVREYWMIIPETERVLVHLFEMGNEPRKYSFSDRVPVFVWNNKCEIDFPLIREELDSLGRDSDLDDTSR